VGKSTLIRHLLYVEEHIKVDLIIEAEDTLWAVEIKSYSTVKSSNLKGLKSFMEDHPNAKPLSLPAVGKSAGFRLAEPTAMREADPNWPKIFRSSAKNHFDNKTNFRYLDDYSFRCNGCLNMLRCLVPSSCPVVARRAKSEARRAKSDLSWRSFSEDGR